MAKNDTKKKLPGAAKAAAPIKTISAKTGYTPPPAGEARHHHKHTRVAILATRWNVEIVEALTAGALRCLKDRGVQDKHIHHHLAPGAYELPLAASALMKTGKIDAVVTLGAVIRGDTPHFDFVAGECSTGLREVSVKHGIALGFGVLTVNTVAQAVERCGSGVDNKGYEAAAAALDMAQFLDALT